MKRPLTYYLLIPTFALHFHSLAQKVGGPCEGCEAIYEFGTRQLSHTDTLLEFDNSQHKLKLFGTVFQPDGKTPAAGVILYIHHTDRSGAYPKPANARGWEQHHGYLRGWVKTDASGQYAFFTFRPGAYPDGSEAAHIHLFVKEPDKNEYYLDDFLFDDDPRLSNERRRKLPQRGGNGIIKTTYANGLLQAKRDIILGLNIPNYE
jgi:protocatechuate 3,4-dioxygenase beta subunit